MLWKWLFELEAFSIKRALPTAFEVSSVGPEASQHLDWNGVRPRSDRIKEEQVYVVPGIQTQYYRWTINQVITITTKHLHSNAFLFIVSSANRSQDAHKLLGCSEPLKANDGNTNEKRAYAFTNKRLWLPSVQLPVPCPRGHTAPAAPWCGCFWTSQQEALDSGIYQIELQTPGAEPLWSFRENLGRVYIGDAGSLPLWNPSRNIKMSLLTDQYDRGDTDTAAATDVKPQNTLRQREDVFCCKNYGASTGDSVSEAWL